MGSADLHKIWGAPDNSRLTAKQQSFRLPTHVAAKINALCDLFPTKTKTEIVGDLLATALDELIANLPVQRGKVIAEHPDHGRVYEAHGMGAEFQVLANKHFREIEKDLGNESLSDLYPDQLVISEKSDDDD
ncbi:MAG TPA: hypothetical protein VGC50_06445 [Gammaproteobacteria bacterium]|jgi:hypothetical protein